MVLKALTVSYVNFLTGLCPVAQRVINQGVQPSRSHNKEWHAKNCAQNWWAWLQAGQREYGRKSKLTLLVILGGREHKFCGIKDLRILEIEHKNSDGSGDRKQFRNSTQ